MDLRATFVFEVRFGVETFAALCRKYGISRKTGYKWVDRYENEGVYGLRELSRAPLVCPHRISEERRESVIALRKAKPWIGPKKIAFELRNLGLKPPAFSTIATILKDAGLVHAPKRRNARVLHHPTQLTIPEGPNHVWAVDYKGWFRLLNGQPCYPLTISDLHSRFLVTCDALDHPAFAQTWHSFENTFKRFGLPQVIRVDNGTPFAGNGAGGISRLSTLWLRLGVDVEFIEPGKPQQNGAHERMHRSLKREVPKADTMRRQQRRLQAWRRNYNHNRGHEFLGLTPPALYYSKSCRKYPDVIPDFSYGAEMDIRKVKRSGEILWQGRWRYINQGLRGSSVGLEENRNGDMNVYAGNVFLGVLPASRSGGLIRPPEREDEN